MPPIPFRGNPMGRRSILPPGYIKVEYLESTGIQYIRSGVHTESGKDVKYVFDAKWTKLLSREQWVGSNFGGQIILHPDGGIKIYGPVLVGRYDATTNVLDHFVYRQDQANSKQWLKMNDQEDIPSATYTFTHFDYEVFLFSVSAAELTYSSNMRIGNFKIYKANELVRNFIPALDPNNKPCMYDTVTKQPFYNKGTGEFSTPPSV